MTLSTLNTLLTKREDAVFTVTVNRADKLNAFNPEVLSELNQVLDRIEKDETLKVVIITGAGEKAFVVGNDLEQLAKLDPVAAYEQMRLGQRTFLRIHEFPKPVIAMVNGYALGGGFELALSCDLIVASEKATFGFPEINLNTMPGWGGTQLAAKKLGLNRAKEMILTGAYYPANVCAEFGFINRIVRHEQLERETMALADQLAEKAPFPLKIAKEAINKGAELGLSDGFQFEAHAYAVNYSAPHTEEGFAKFLNRTK
ncbi:enoyl-CoA hydratase/isomerase family protein [Alkalihalobacillus oceani]|uniref:Enoyl-CoA hydratase/isomerase family protein n=1 Tax=Halalkalibacter oceani TaxID=1653776 RepID=A0A9X2DQI6_9BACI|nr:enoyl-CoA hydratase/isomerase family protein [Halalkalibacter oceani]MCM3715209.1 enoyl-CoA hydratase/isomerase family protein [Halalkalibacter oceani]